ncbi:MAG: hypothetical protein JWL71_3206, partial [Acidobacteria bacterium]|nr:hypothetical protein [Acidobacteriota bacterium]
MADWNTVINTRYLCSLGSWARLCGVAVALAAAGACASAPRGAVP